uniref:Uncharacterized protein n=1 Tax=Siphoviridae sp. ctYtb10 TaxID=2825553 RepID=A0A8S5P979_9CAUD|nr:MAG TPA: hypothetical protein [Siphoviridae sp. ctYtb10]
MLIWLSYLNRLLHYRLLLRKNIYNCNETMTK